MSLGVSLNTTGTVPASDTAANPATVRLTKAAHEFEGMLLNSLWKSMHESFGPSDEDSDGTAEGMNDIGSQALCSGVAAAGGLGIAKMLLRHLPVAKPGGSSDLTENKGLINENKVPVGAKGYAAIGR